MELNRLWITLAGLFQTAFKGSNNLDPNPLIPRQVLFGNPNFTSVQISPDGRWLAYLAPVHNVLNIWTRPLDSLTTAGKSLTSEKGRGVQVYSWMNDNNHILFSYDSNGDENWKLYKLNVVTGEKSAVVDYNGVMATVICKSDKRPDEVIIGANDRDPRYHDLYVLNVQSGSKVLVLNNTYGFGIEGFLCDEQLNVRLASKPRSDAGKDFYKWDPFTQQWSLYRSVSKDDAETAPIGFDKAELNVYWLDTENSDLLTLVQIDFNDVNRRQTLFSPTKSDITNVVMHPVDKIPMLLTEDYMRESVVYMSDSIKQDFEYLASNLGDTDNIHIVGTSNDFTRWLIAYATDINDTSYFYYNRGVDVAYLFSESDTRANYNYTHMIPVEITTRDGLTEVCYVSLPFGTASKSHSLLPATPLPLILDVHGGPWARDHWRFNPTFQWVTNRGYAVISCNFRGSTGYGKRFLKAGNGEWGRKMQDDLTDAVNWAIEHRLADPKRIAIVGGSYGGYAALAGMTFTPDLYACGVDIVGISNLITLLNSIPPYWESMRALQLYRIGGDPNTTSGQEFLRQRSPLFFVQNVKKPLLIAQGANDPRVNQRESDQMVEALKKYGVPVTYILFPDEGHGFQRPENAIADYAVIEGFLKKCLGGRAEPVGIDLDKSTVKIMEGSVD